MTSLSCAIRSQSLKIVKFVIFELLIFLNGEKTCDLTDVPASNYDRKRTLNFSTPSTTFYDDSVSCNLFSKAEVRQFAGTNAFETVGNRRVNKCILIINRLCKPYKGGGL